MKAVKDNKVYTVDEVSKNVYLSQGYDIVDDSGKIIEYTPSASVPYSEYARLKSELEELKSKKR